MPAKSASKFSPLAIAAAVAALVAIVAVGAYATMTGGGGTAVVFETQPVQRMDLDVTVQKDGELQAIQSNDINSEVDGSTTLVELIAEGSYVNAGDVLGRLDSSEIEREIEETELELQAAEAEVVNDEEQLAIAKSQADADIEAAEVELTLAQLDLKQYEEGVYPQLKADAETKVEMARIDLKNAEEELLQTQTLFARSFVTASEVKKKELAVIKADNALKKAETDYEVLTEYTHPKDQTSKRNALAQQQKKLTRVKRQSAATIAQREASVRQKNLRLLNRQERMDEMQAQLEATTLVAPINGLVVYGAAGNHRESDQIVEGAQVRERQTIIRLPDTSRMKAVVKINESRVGRIEPGQRAVIRTSAAKEPLSATVSEISVMADNNNRWFNPDVREYPVELVLDETPPSLKPGMKAMATIYVDRREDVPAVPLTAIYTVGDERYVFVPRGGGRAEPVEVQTGAMNATHAEIVSGVDPGTSVVLLEVGQGRELLEDAGINPEPPVQRRPGQRGGEEATAKRPVDAKGDAGGKPVAQSDQPAATPAPGGGE